MMRLFEYETENMRDIGGYKCGENKEIRYNRFIRSNVPVNLSEASLSELIRNNITTVIDLRTPEETERKKSVFLNNNRFKYYNAEIAGGGRIPGSPEEITDSYIEMLNGKEAIREIFGIIAKSEGGVIYYCNAGKDRTGIITALILKLLGVSDKDIIEDYVLSGIYLEKTLKKFAETSAADNILQIITPKSDTMMYVLDYIEKEFNGVESYLTGAGVSQKEINSLKAASLKNIK